MKTLESLIQDLTLDELKQGYYELKEWHREGALGKGIIRQVHESFLQANGLKALDFGIRNVENPWLLEIAKRTFEKES